MYIYILCFGFLDLWRNKDDNILLFSQKTWDLVIILFQQQTCHLFLIWRTGKKQALLLQCLWTYLRYKDREHVPILGYAVLINQNKNVCRQMYVSCHFCKYFFVRRDVWLENLTGEAHPTFIPNMSVSLTNLCWFYFVLLNLLESIRIQIEY